MDSPSRKNEIATLLVAILFYIIAVFVSAKSVLHGWVGLLFLPAYIGGTICVLATSIIILIRNPVYRFKIPLLIFSFIFMCSSYFIVGDNGDATGTYWQGTEYGIDSIGSKKLPTIIQSLSLFGYLGFAIFGLLSMAFMIVFASSRKRNSTGGQSYAPSATQ